jgi:hypothetical protein
MGGSAPVVNLQPIPGIVFLHTHIVTKQLPLHHSSFTVVYLLLFAHTSTSSRCSFTTAALALQAYNSCKRRLTHGKLGTIFDPVGGG